MELIAINCSARDLRFGDRVSLLGEGVFTVSRVQRGPGQRFVYIEGTLPDGRESTRTWPGDYKVYAARPAVNACRCSSADADTNTSACPVHATKRDRVADGIAAVLGLT